ncbi:unnamed protein product [Danaus chrysippus]|uniref:(African queen) hypothetical protein n=1 Tax=Danaus chrysippus TaxID=151541 RepID=A0A8J2W7Q8_9NEOP|nr:unnamed protein product [Danaus chrysippus]
MYMSEHNTRITSQGATVARARTTTCLSVVRAACTASFAGLARGGVGGAGGEARPSFAAHRLLLVQQRRRGSGRHSSSPTTHHSHNKQLHLNIRLHTTQLRDVIHSVQVLNMPYRTSFVQVELCVHNNYIRQATVERGDVAEEHGALPRGNYLAVAGSGGRREDHLLSGLACRPPLTPILNAS